MMKLTASVLRGFVVVVAFAGSAFAGDVGGNVELAQSLNRKKYA